MLKLGGIASEEETVNFLLYKVGESYITSYVNHISCHLNSRKAPQAESFFEVKNYT